MLTNAAKNEQPSRVKSPANQRFVGQSPVNVTVLERFAPEVTEFENIDEFKEYLAENEEDMNKLSTVKLNRQFKINGYRIPSCKEKYHYGRLLTQMTKVPAILH